MNNIAALPALLALLLIITGAFLLSPESQKALTTDTKANTAIPAPKIEVEIPVTVKMKTTLDLNQMFVEAEDLGDSGRHLASARLYQTLAWLLETQPDLAKDLSDDFDLDWAQSQASQQYLLAGQQVWHGRLQAIDKEIRERNKEFQSP